MDQQAYEAAYRAMRAIYDKHRRRYRHPPDSKQMCCMWSTNRPPDFLEGTPPLCDMERVFGIHIKEEDAVEIYDMDLDRAARKIVEMRARSMPARRFPPTPRKGVRRTNNPRRTPECPLPGATGFTSRQGRYLSFIHSYTQLHRRPPAEADIQAYFGVTAPAVHSMILTLERRGLISREPGRARSIRVLVPPADLPALEGDTTPSRRAIVPPAREVAIVARLGLEEAVEVLRRILAAHPELEGEVRWIVDKVLRDVSFEDVANKVGKAPGGGGLEMTRC